jgi:DNA replication protein DnaC
LAYFEGFKNAFGKAHIITANLSLDDLAQKLGDDRLSSRIAGMSEVIEVIGPDMRLVKH